MLECVDILGVSVLSGETRDVVSFIDDRIDRSVVTRVAFLNTNLANQAQNDKKLKASLNGGFVVLNDGIGVDVARYCLHGKMFKNNLNGTDFTSSYLNASRINLRIFLLGAREEVVRKTAEKIRELWSRHTVVGTQHGYLDDLNDQTLENIIARAKPDLILVAMGNPKQERWIASKIPNLCPAAFGVGAWFDFVTDTVPRAPIWVRRLRGEWIFRLCLEPRRMVGRYVFGNTIFLLRVFRTRMVRSLVALQS